MAENTAWFKNLLLIHNLPPGTEFGIDYNSWYIGPKFCGLHAIPDGFHFVFTSSVDKHQQHAPRNGQFVILADKKNEGSIFHEASWDDSNEELRIFKEYRTSFSENEVTYISPYPLDEKFETWKKLTSLITKETLNRIYPLCQRISPSTQVDCTAELEKKERKKLGITDTDDGVFANVRVRFTKIPEQKFPDGANPQEITKYSIDNSYALERMFQEIGKPNAESEILAEVQFAFVCFMIGQVFDAFEHWKALIRLICRCDEAVSKRPAFFKKFIDVIEIQIREIPEDFFVDIVAEQNFLVHTFQGFFSTLRDVDNLDRTLKLKCEGLKSFLMGTFQCDLELENDEELAVIVDV